MELKDWLPLAGSAIAILISLKTLRINQRRERRETEAHLPRIDFLGMAAGRNEYGVAYSVTNRGDYPLILHDVAIVEPPPHFRIDDPAGGLPMAFETRPVGATILPGNTFKEHVTVSWRHVDPGRAQRALTLAFKTSVRGQRGSERLQVVRREL